MTSLCTPKICQGGVAAGGGLARGGALSLSLGRACWESAKDCFGVVCCRLISRRETWGRLKLNNWTIIAAGRVGGGGVGSADLRDILPFKRMAAKNKIVAGEAEYCSTVQ